MAGTPDDSMNFYNEFDPKSAAWLRELIGRGLIPDGVVDERSITEIAPDDLHGFTQCHFFAGIGGWSYALRLAGVPAATRLWTGSCPCQPFSSAGKGLAQKDERHLWPVFFDLIRQCRPECVFGEQVASSIGHGWLDGISADLEAEGYACGAVVLGAHSVSAPHIRQRLYWAADSKHAERREVGVNREDGRDGQDGGREEARSESGTCGQVCGLDDARCQGDERRGESGNLGCSPSEKQGEAWERERSGDADSDSVQDDHRLVLADSDGCQQGSPAAETTGYGGAAEPAGSRTGWVGNSNIQQTYPAEPGQQVPSERLLRCWDASQLVPCRDGKTRRVPTEPLLQRVANGIPLAVDHLRDAVRELETQIAHYAKKTNGTTLEAVREMQHAFWSEAIQWDARGRIGILSPEILLAALCQLEGELGGIKLCSSQSIIKTQRAIMLRVQEYAAKEAAARPPPGREHAQQLAREFADSLHELSYESALEGAQSIFDRALGFPLTSGCPARTTLLRGYGNAIVPQVASVFIQEFLKL